MSAISYGFLGWIQVGMAALLVTTVVACQSDSHPPQQDDGLTRPPTSKSAKPAATASTATNSPGSDGAVPAPQGDGGFPDAPAANCGALVCRGHGKCTEDDQGAKCVCDTGYVAEGAGNDYECVVDKTCKRLHMLQETGCIQLVNSAPAVALFFAVDYCAGTAVLPKDLGNLSDAFHIYENGEDLSDESVAQVIERDVESYVTIAVDISKSVSGSADDPAKRARLSAVTSQLRSFVANLEAPDGGAPVSVSLMVFGRFVSEYVPYTTDLDSVDRALSNLESAPDAVVQTVSAQGTALFEAVQKGIQSVERIQRLRSLVTEGGVLTSGTLVVVTDGEDTTGGKIDTNQLKSTLVNVISVGISSSIAGESLDAIGRDGSFLAPTQTDWEASFGEIATRVRQYPERAYLLAYCTSHTMGSPEVSVGLSNEDPIELASCKFNADVFSKDPVVASLCDLNFFDHACDENECGTMFACGACQADACCVAGSCQAPSSAPNCHNQDALCAPSGGRCSKLPEGDDEFECVDGPGQGEKCGANSTCARGFYCSDDNDAGEPRCVPIALANGETCGEQGDLDSNRCPESNCAQESPTIDNYVCKPRARANDACSGSADAECEPGTYCKGNVCKERGVFVNCTQDVECGTGYCDRVAHACVETGACYFDWNSVVNP